MSADVDTLLRSGLFLMANQEELVALASSLKRKSYRRGEVVYHQDDPPGGLFIVEHGTVKLRLPSAGGKPFTIGWVTAGGYFGTISLFGEIVRSETAIALEDTGVLLLERTHFRSFLHKHPGAAEFYLEVLANRWRRTLAQVGDFMTLDVLGRVARVLLELMPRFGTADVGGAITIRLLTQVELAALVGASRESVAQALRTLGSEGFIAVQEGQIQVLDSAGLQSHLH